MLLLIVCDMNPIRQYRDWIGIQLAPLMNHEYKHVPLYQVDAHNVVVHGKNTFLLLFV
jgi:hypothetical protein